MNKKRRKPKRTRRRSMTDQEMVEKLRKRYRVEPLQKVKITAIRKALVATKGDAILAAALLGIGKTSVYRHRDDK